MAGIFAREGEREHYAPSHPLNLLWNAFRTHLHPPSPHGSRCRIQLLHHGLDVLAHLTQIYGGRADAARRVVPG